MTKQRRLILQIIESSHAHPTAEDIFQEARKQMPKIALGTVYRNLNSLVEDGFIRRVTTSGTPDRFDHIKVKHDHLVCRNCGQIKDVETDGIINQLKSITGEDISSYELNAFYLCEACKSKEVM
ncbi:MAG: transcriptional repressor [Firmicutes bacterium]|nr:transcriptional repressor [Bacillota bacterium]